MRYYHEIPISQWNEHFQYIIEELYGVTEHDCYIVQRGVESVRLGFEVNPRIPFINSLPATIIEGRQRCHYDNVAVLNAVKDKISYALADIINPVGIYHTEPRDLFIDPRYLKSIIKQLARNRFITKFAQLTDSKFVAYVAPHVVLVIVQIRDCELIINIYEDIKEPFFDINSGYQDIFRCLNRSFNIWKRLDDVTLPIHIPNYV